MKIYIFFSLPIYMNISEGSKASKYQTGGIPHYYDDAIRILDRHWDIASFRRDHLPDSELSDYLLPFFEASRRLGSLVGLDSSGHTLLAKKLQPLKIPFPNPEHAFVRENYLRHVIYQGKNVYFLTEKALTFSGLERKIKT